MAAAVAPLAALLQQLDARISALESKAGVAPPAAATAVAAAPGGTSSAGLSKLAEEFNVLVQKFGVAFAETCSAIGGDATVIGEHVLKLWTLTSSVIDMAGKSKKWDDAVGLFTAPHSPQLEEVPHSFVLRRHRADEKEGVGTVF
jgi:hypothetical protein